MIRFRPHRGSLHAAMAEAVTLSDRQALIAHLQATHADLQEFVGAPDIRDETVHVTKYGHGIDTRIGWNTHIVEIDGWGPAGFTDGPC